MPVLDKTKKGTFISARSKSILDRMIEDVIERDANTELRKKAEGIKMYSKEKGL